jgi:hypothetical protein
MRMLDSGMGLREIRVAIDQSYANLINASTPTPYPPA